MFLKMKLRLPCTLFSLLPFPGRAVLIHSPVRRRHSEAEWSWAWRAWLTLRLLLRAVGRNLHIPPRSS